jgi:hypothetical protein
MVHPDISRPTSLLILPSSRSGRETLHHSLRADLTTITNNRTNHRAPEQLLHPITARDNSLPPSTQRKVLFNSRRLNNQDTQDTNIRVLEREREREL